MGFRFRRSIKLADGFRLNLGRSGPSFSVGGRGAHETIGRRGVTRSVGLPGSGISYQTRRPWHHHARRAARSSPGKVLLGLAVIGIIWWIAVH